MLIIVIYAIMTTSCTNINHDLINTSSTPSEQPTLLSNSSSNQVDLTCIKLGCWADIFPSSTTAIKAQTLLETLYGKDKVKVFQNNIDWQTTDSESEAQFGRLNIDKQGIVDEIDITFPSGQLTVAELVNQIDEPAFVYIARAISSESKCAGSFVSYPNIGLSAWLSPINLSVGIQPTQFVHSIMLLSAKDAANSSIYDYVKLKWEGYKEYCALIDN